jgi:hypothetical protein
MLEVFQMNRFFLQKNYVSIQKIDGSSQIIEKEMSRSEARKLIGKDETILQIEIIQDSKRVVSYGKYWVQRNHFAHNNESNGRLVVFKII